MVQKAPWNNEKTKIMTEASKTCSNPVSEKKPKEAYLVQMPEELHDTTGRCTIVL